MHYLPGLRKVITKKKKQKPQRLRLSQPLDFYTERSKSSTTSGAVPTETSSRPIGQRLRPQLIRERVAAAVAVPEELRHWAEDFPWRRAMHAAIAAAVIVGVCVAALIMAQTPEVEQPTCDEDCMLYTKLFNETMDWSVDPCQDFYRFVCGRVKNKLSVRHQISYHFVQAVADLARQVDVPAEGQTAAQKAARLFKTCNDIATQDTDYVPRIRGYMRDANLHWPQHPETRDIESVDVFRSILELNEKWGWPSLLELRTNNISETWFEVVTRPTGGIDAFQYHVLNLGLGSPAHRTYFETLCAHYGVGVVDGVTFEEMLHYEDQIMAPLLRAYYAPPRRYVFERNHSDTSGTWERWTSVIEEFYHLSGNERVEISTTHEDYFKVMVELITTKETIVELVLGWIAVQYTSPFANRQLIANYHNTLQHAEEYHRTSCFVFTSYLMGIALFLPFLQRVYTEPVRTDVHHIAREVRRTVYQTLELGTYPWAELDVVFKYMEIARVDDIEARFGAAFMHALYYSDSEIKAF
ncbi:neprilysin-1-like [Dermacentor silvarum]|uniref:neprilysin-1-like n=1 Tax=Dermacentor silvarum TaxID=543639 RepID=UPI0021015970|nr:neprilysin-1-like [Dermacentor silvarum]